MEKAASLLKKAQAAYQATGEIQRLFTSFSYQADSWTRPRRIIAKVEYTRLGANQRFVITNLVRNPSLSTTTSTCSRATWKTASRS